MNAEIRLTDDMESCQATHPGTIIKLEIQERGLSQRDLSSLTGIKYRTLNSMLNAHTPISIEMALLIGAALGINAKTFLRLQMDYDVHFASKNIAFTKQILDICDAVGKEFV